MLSLHVLNERLICEWRSLVNFKRLIHVIAIKHRSKLLSLESVLDSLDFVADSFFLRVPTSHLLMSGLQIAMLLYEVLLFFLQIIHHVFELLSAFKPSL